MRLQISASVLARLTIDDNENKNGDEKFIK